VGVATEWTARSRFRRPRVLVHVNSRQRGLLLSCQRVLSAPDGALHLVTEVSLARQAQIRINRALRALRPFRARLSVVPAQGRLSADRPPALTTVPTIVLAVGTIAVLLMSCEAAGPAPAQNPVSSPVTATPSSLPGVMASPTAIPLPTTAQFSTSRNNVVWGFIASVALFRSSDAGSSWEQRPLPPSDRGLGNPEISFVDGYEGWLLTTGPPTGQCQSQETAIWHTTDAGAMWRLVNASGVGDAQCKRGLSFVDQTHGFLAGWDESHAPVIYRTADAGRTWSASRPMPDPPGFTTQPGGISLRPGRVRAFGSTLMVTAGSYVFRSTDGGASWTYLATTPPTSTSIAFVTASRWLELIVPGQHEETLDAGASWHPYTSDYSQAAPIAPDVVFANSQVGYATVRGGLKRTVDGGAHWSELHTPGTG
jgi:photosystem II stability/assembly factor-like uncharacterized protein